MNDTRATLPERLTDVIVVIDVISAMEVVRKPLRRAGEILYLKCEEREEHSHISMRLQDRCNLTPSTKPNRCQSQITCQGAAPEGKNHPSKMKASNAVLSSPNHHHKGAVPAPAPRAIRGVKSQRRSSYLTGMLLHWYTLTGSASESLRSRWIASWRCTIGDQSAPDSVATRSTPAAQKQCLNHRPHRHRWPHMHQAR